jgi:hypothetical protein
MKYQAVNFNLNEKQIKKIQAAKVKNMAVSISINKEQFDTGEHTLYLTKSQHKKLTNMKRKKGRITISKTQMKHQNGGFLSAILPIVKSFLPTIGKVLGQIGLAGATGAVKGLAEKVTKGEGCIEGIQVIIPKEDAESIIKMVHEFECRNIIPVGTTEMTKHGIQQQNGGFIAPLLGVLGSVVAPLISKIFTGNGLYRAGSQQAKGLYRAGTQRANGLKRVLKKRKI